MHQFELCSGSVVKINGIPVRLLDTVQAESGTDPHAVMDDHISGPHMDESESIVVIAERNSQANCKADIACRMLELASKEAENDAPKQIDGDVIDAANGFLKEYLKQ